MEVIVKQNGSNIVNVKRHAADGTGNDGEGLAMTAYERSRASMTREGQSKTLTLKTVLSVIIKNGLGESTRLHNYAEGTPSVSLQI
jgi:hypothetical protein